MNCLILAAGYGSRLRELSESKPLATVAGVPLIEHVVRRAMEAGVTRFTVVTGHAADRVEAFLSDLSSRIGVPIEPVRISNYDLANGHSVLAGAAAIEGDYLLSMSDHLFDPAIIRDLIAGAPDDAAVTLAVDRKLDGPLLDIDDATKVQTDAEGRIIAIGKQLTRYNAIDTGLFLATPALASAIRDSIAAGSNGSLSAGMEWLAAEGRARTADTSGEWIDVDSPHCHALAEAWIAPVTGTSS